MIENLFIFCSTEELFELNKDLFKPESVVFIGGDNPKIFVLNTFFPCPFTKEQILELLNSKVNILDVVGMKSKSATGAEIFNDYSSNTATGEYSHVEGLYNTASGNHSHAENRSSAHGDCSHAEGFNCVAEGNLSHVEGSNNNAIGDNSHAEGSGTRAEANASHSEGKSTIASGDPSHAEGYLTTASGAASHSEGTGTTASGNYSHAEGDSTNAVGLSSHSEGELSTASGYASHAEGNSTAKESYSHAEGKSTANGLYSHSEGRETVANVSAAHAEGLFTEALGIASHTTGHHTIANNNFEFACGTYNFSGNGTTKFSIGIGDSEDNRKNAFEIHGDGKIFVNGLGGYEGSSSYNKLTLQQLITQLLNALQEISNTATALENHKNNQDKKHIPDGGHEGLILSWESEGTAKWEDLTNVFSGLEEILAYGVQWDTTVSDPHLTRIGNMSLHKTLPIQSQLKGCIAQGNKVQYWLDENDWKWRKDPVTLNMTLAVADGVYTIVDALFADNRYKDQWLRINNIPCKVTAIDTGSTTATLTPDEAIEAGAYDVELGAVLNGYDGTVRVYCPNFYIKSYSEGNIRKVYISTVKIDASWTRQHEILVDAYGCTILNTVPEDMGYLSTLPADSAISVVNTETYCRGLGNLSGLDANYPAQPFNTALGKPKISLSRAITRTYVRNAGSEMLSYEQYKNIFYWLWVVEYANFNSQEAYNDELTSEGYRQGGMGAGVTTGDREVDVTYGLIPCGYCNEFGNGTGVKTAIFSNGSSVEVPRWRGFDNSFGDIWTSLDGVLIDTPLAGASDTSVLPTCYIITDPEKYTDSLDGILEKADRIYQLPSREGYIGEWHLGDSADIVPESTGGGATSKKCDYYDVRYNNLSPLMLLSGGNSSNGTLAGLGAFNCRQQPSFSTTFTSFRSVSVLGS